MTILNETTVTIVDTWNLASFIIILCFAGLFLTLTVVYDSETLGIIFIVTLVSLIISLITLLATAHVEVHREVVLDDKYPATKLLDEYEVIKQRGEIYEVELKDADKES